MNPAREEALFEVGMDTREVVARFEAERQALASSRNGRRNVGTAPWPWTPSTEPAAASRITPASGTSRRVREDGCGSAGSKRRPARSS
jgi:hypothetical protein